ncbi:MAG: hypothetical protein KIT16_07235 [Rhodospirillaceae bacterium]|nr:hypothetical protein [Rhodospirillaceae bacterium]
MSFEQQNRRAFGRARNFVMAAAGAAIAFAVAGASVPAMAQQQMVDSYSFHGLTWGMKLADARKALGKAGYRVTGVTAGKRREFAIDRLHAVYATIDRGKRLVAVGKVEGYPVTIELAFGKHDSLNHVFIMSQYWNRTLPGARALIAQAEKTVASLEKKYGPAKKRIDDRWPDTAYWGSSKDGSTLSVHVRGINGFMFSPSYRTAMRIDYANAKFSGGQIAGVKMDLNSTGWTDGPAIVPASTTSAVPQRTAPGRWVNENFIGR